MCTLKCVTNKYTVLYFREDESTRRICTVILEEQMLLILLQSFLHVVWKLTYILLQNVDKRNVCCIYHASDKERR